MLTSPCHMGAAPQPSTTHLVTHLLPPVTSASVPPPPRPAPGSHLAKDVMSKHAMHANCATEVWCAGEFCVVDLAKGQEEQQAAQLPPRQRYKLVIDNNSGTYAPAPGVLSHMQELLTSTFPGLLVEAVAQGSSALKEYRSQCPEMKGR